MGDIGPLAELGVVLARLGAAALIGGMIGLNREMHGKPAGLRTLALVSLGSALATRLGIEVTVSNNLVADLGAVTRIIQGILTGIGFLGAGVIFRDSGIGGKVTGLTTAATIWVVACLGMACGAGRWQLVIAATAITFLILVIGGPFEKRADEILSRGRHKGHKGEPPEMP